MIFDAFVRANHYFGDVQMKRFFLKTLGASLVSLALVGATTTAIAQDKTIKLGIQNPKGHPLAQGAERFAELVATKSGGKLKVNVFVGGQMGSDAATVSAMQAGTVEMSAMNSGILASQVKDFALFDFPFMFNSAKEADAVVDGAFGKSMHAKLADKGLVGLSYWELGFRNMTNSKRAINKVEDLAGLKLRVIPNPINVDWVKALDANPTPLAFTELFAALEQKAVDGQENPLSVILANRFAEVQKHLTLTRHQYNPQSLLVSKKFFDTLSVAEQKVLQEAAVEAGAFQRQVSRDKAASELDALRQAGMQVTELSATELAKLQEKMGPVITKHAQIVGAESVNMLVGELSKLRK